MTRSRRDGGGATLEWVGMAVLTGFVVSALAIVITGGQVMQHLNWATCVIGGGDCARPGTVTGPATTGGTCQLPTSGPLGSPRGTFAVDLGGGQRALVEQANGGGYRVVVPQGAQADPARPAYAVPFETGTSASAGVESLLAGSAGADVYHAGSLSEAQAVVSGLAADREFTSVFPKGDGGLSAAWSSVGDGLRAVTGQRPAPAPAATFEPSSRLASASQNAYGLSTDLGAPDAPPEPIGVLRRGDGTSTSYSVKSTQLSGGEAAQFVVEVDRDSRGNIYGVRTTSGQQGLETGTDGLVRPAGEGATYVTNLDIRDQADAQAASTLLNALGAEEPQTFSYPVAPAGGATAPDAPTLDQAMTAFGDAASAHGYASRQPYAPSNGAAAVLASGTTTTADGLPAAIADFNKTQPAGEQWTGVGWQSWNGCR